MKTYNFLVLVDDLDGPEDLRGPHKINVCVSKETPMKTVWELAELKAEQKATAFGRVFEYTLNLKNEEVSK